MIMAKKIGLKRRRRLIQDIMTSKHDLVALGETHHLSPDDLANWIADPENHRALSGLCVLADLQTQILLSRYRLLAAGQLIELATGDGKKEASDVSRRACVDLLKLDLKRANFEEAGRGIQQDAQSEADAEISEMTHLRELLYGATDGVKTDKGDEHQETSCLEAGG